MVIGGLDTKSILISRYILAHPCRTHQSITILELVKESRHGGLKGRTRFGSSGLLSSVPSGAINSFNYEHEASVEILYLSYD